MYVCPCVEGGVCRWMCMYTDEGSSKLPKRLVFQKNLWLVISAREPCVHVRTYVYAHMFLQGPMHGYKTMLAVICYVGCSLQHTYVRTCVCTYLYLSKCLLVHRRATTVQHLVVRGGAGVHCTTPLSDCCVIVHSPQMCCGHMYVST